MEIVLAIGLTSVVMYLLMTAIELYMVRVDSSRSRVESAQLARTILDQMAADIAATRLFAPSAQAMGGGPSGGGAQNSGGSLGSNGSNGFSSGTANGFSGASNGSSEPGGGNSASAGALTTLPAQVQGVFGTIDQLRIDRAAYPNWQRASRQVLPEEPATAADMPASVRYYLNDGDRQTSQEFALQGVPEEDETSDRRAGLYRELYTTAALADESDPLDATIQRDGARIELLAPEVVKMELNYFDGTQFVDEWDSFEQGALPAGIEILLTIYEPSFADSLSDEPQQRLTGQPSYRENELVEYRRFVRLPSISPAQPAEALMPVSGGNENQAAEESEEDEEDE
ncbi:MAG TPA: hypothetical protein VF175_01155 [Lacipirellula sp.]